MKNEPIFDNLLFDKIAVLIETARQKVATAVNLAMVYTYFDIGRMIVEDEQQGKERAKYGKHTIKDLSKRLSQKFGNGFSERNLEQMRQFYLTYSISQTASAELKKQHFTVSWSHYLILMRIKNLNERSFYEIECAAQNWGVKQLNRQYHSSLYERLALSMIIRNTPSVLAQSDGRFLPSNDRSFNFLQIVESCGSLLFTASQYLLAAVLPVKISIISTIEKYISPSCSIRRMGLFSNISN